MIMLRFTKMNGAGNDFILIDNRAGDIHLDRGQIARLCDRHRGIGADGVLLLEEPSNHADFRMRYFNADGGEAEMCGNGARCFARFAKTVAGSRDKILFETPPGIIGAQLHGDLVTLNMGDPTDLQMNVRLQIEKEEALVHYINTGVPHVVIHVSRIDVVDVRSRGKKIRQHDMFSPKGANVNFLEKRGPKEIAIRTYERGVEDETLACGTGVVASGESPTLLHKELEQLIRLAVATANTRCLVLAGTGSNATEHAVLDTKLAEKLGVDGALLVAPYYNKPSQEGLFRHFKAIAEATSLPIILYNIPGRCSVDITPETVGRLAKECRNIVSIKEASGSVDRVSDLRRRLPESFTILSGDDSLTLPFMSVGAAGVVSVASNLFPSEVCALVRACESGDLKSASKLHRRLLPLFKDLFIEPNPVPVKTALGWRGAMSGEVRLPLCEMSEANQARLRKTLEDFEQNT